MRKGDKPCEECMHYVKQDNSMMDYCKAYQTALRIIRTENCTRFKYKKGVEKL